MQTEKIINGPAADELLNLMLSNLPVTFSTLNGSVEILIEQLREAGGNRLWFFGQVSAGKRKGMSASGYYHCSSKTGYLDD